VVTAPVEDPEGGPMTGTPTVFDPTRVVDGIELSDDPILRYRPDAYTESVSRRTTSTS
jgi:catalase